MKYHPLPYFIQDYITPKKEEYFSCIAVSDTEKALAIKNLSRVRPKYEIQELSVFDAMREQHKDLQKFPVVGVTVNGTYGWGQETNPLQDLLDFKKHLDDKAKSYN